MQWKYGKLKNLDLSAYAAAPKEPVRPNHEQFKALAARATGATYNFVIINGEVDATLSSLDAIPKSLHWKKSAKRFSDLAPDRFSDALDSNPGISLELELADETSLDRPIKFLFFNSQVVGEKAFLIQPKIFIRVGNRSKIQIITETVGAKDADYLLNGRVFIESGVASNIEFVKVSEDSDKCHQVWRVSADPKKDSSMTLLFGNLNAGLNRNEVHVPIQDENVQNKVFAFGVTRGSSLFDLQSVIDHQVGNSTTTQICKFIADDESRAVFGGRVLIAQDAQKTYIEQLNQNILLSNKAEIDSEPQLEIDADDVKASHGSTTGGLDPQEIFYLQSRAIPKHKALEILSFGFLNDVVQRLENDVLKSETEKCLRQYMHGEGRL